MPDDDGDPIALLQSCIARKWEGRTPGLCLEDHFELPHLRRLYPDELLSFCVPDSYDAQTPVGLLVLLHGGGSGTPRDTAKSWLLQSEAPSSYHFGAPLAAHSFVSVAPSNLLRPTHQRWSNPESDAYLLGVVEEAAYRFNIDPNRVFLLGQSMGGYGACHIVQTLGDRFATVGSHAGAWFYGFWEGLHGVDFYNMHGAHDAVPGTRPRFTDVAFARLASAILSGHHLPHTYVEHQGGHSLGDPAARQACLDFLEYIKAKQRDPIPPRVVTASRKGAFSLYDSPHFFWVSIDETHFGTFELDHVETTEPQPSYCTTNFRHRTIRCQGGTVSAFNDGANTISIHTQNVYGLTIWLNPGMVDFDKPVRVVINGETRHDAPVQRSLITAIESFLRRRDPGMLFSAKLSFDLKVDDWTRIRSA
ncbi:MAG: hypothetical protein A3K18_20215 [Lentisphaerae bacterium RIFOXYA12_64_32]|nr:MAG: hypothetical protein A3K18_20215 [Lentisphaerae bacterium RIFOXYA12_64_32]